jgi:GT2 family glycosyltransferase
VSIIVVSYNTKALLEQSLTSIEAQRGPVDEVIVVDNASPDGSADMVRNRFTGVRLLASGSNLGFARANNQALAMARGDLVWLLNPDTRLEPGALAVAATFMQAHPDLGMAGTALINPDGSAQPSVEYRYPGQRCARSLLGDLPGEIAWVLGASIVAWRRVLETVGGFDEHFFLYGEDLDLGLAVRKAGWPIGFIEDAVVTHYGGESERGNPPDAVMERKFRAEMIFYRKHYDEATVGRIKRKNRIQAAWRLLTLAPLRWLVPHHPTVARKYGFYRLSWRFFGTSS